MSTDRAAPPAWLVWAVALGVLAVAALLAVWLVRTRQVPTPLPAGDGRPLVRTVVVRHGPVDLAVEAHGTVLARGAVDLAAEVAGLVLRLSPALEPGGAFAAGDLLVEIDPRDHLAREAAAAAELAAAELGLSQEQALAAQAEAEWRRLGGGEAPPLTRRAPQLAAATAHLEAARAALEHARLDVARTRVLAPFPGRVRERRVEVGRLVERGTPLAAIHSDQAVDVPLPIRDGDLAHLGLAVDFDELRLGTPGPAVELHADFAGTTRTWRGRVVRSAGVVDATTRLVTLIARVEQPFAAAAGDSPLVPGMFVAARITGRRLETALVLPRTALREDGTVLVVGADGVLVARPAPVVRLIGDDAVLAAMPGGPADGERVCVHRVETLVPGARVRLAEAVPPTTPPDHAPGRSPDGAPDRAAVPR